MVKLEIDQLPNYPTRQLVPLMVDDDGNPINPPMYYPVPDFEIVGEGKITIMDDEYQQVDSKLSNRIFHFLYGPEELTNRVLLGKLTPRLFFKNRQKNNWIMCSEYGQPMTLFTSDVKGLNSDISNQMIYTNSYVVDSQHPYCEQIINIGKEYEITPWPWATLEVSIGSVRKGDFILGQLQLYEIDLCVRHYIEIDDISPITAYQLTR